MKHLIYILFIFYFVGNAIGQDTINTKDYIVVNLVDRYSNELIFDCIPSVKIDTVNAHKILSISKDKISIASELYIYQYSGNCRFLFEKSDVNQFSKSDSLLLSISMCGYSDTLVSVALKDTYCNIQLKAKQSFDVLINNSFVAHPSPDALLINPNDDSNLCLHDIAANVRGYNEFLYTAGGRYLETYEPELIEFLDDSIFALLPYPNCSSFDMKTWHKSKTDDSLGIYVLYNIGSVKDGDKYTIMYKDDNIFGMRLFLSSDIQYTYLYIQHLGTKTNYLVSESKLVLYPKDRKSIKKFKKHKFHRERIISKSKEYIVYDIEGLVPRNYEYWIKYFSETNLFHTIIPLEYELDIQTLFK